jgi:hypothetical protein
LRRPSPARPPRKATAVFLGVFAGFIKGKNVIIPKGAQILAYADEDKVLPTPVTPPPPSDD